VRTVRSSSSSIPEPDARSNLGQRIGEQLYALAGWAGVSAQTREELERAFALFTRESLDQPVSPPFGGLSRINASGLPFQWLIRCAANGAGFGFLCEAGRPGTAPEERFELSMRRLLDWDARATWFADIAAIVMPGPSEAWPAHWRSAMWMGAGPSPGGVQVKPYLNLNRGPARDRWLRVGYVLQQLGRLRSLERLCALSGRASAGSWPVGLAVDVLPCGLPGRVKVYFRSEPVRAGWLERWYAPVGMREQLGLMRRGLDLFPWLGTRPYPERAFILSLEFHPEDGELSLKTDFAVTKWMESEQSIRSGTRALIQALGGEVQPFDEALRLVGACSGAAVTRFVGVGAEPDGSNHVNVYLEPPLSPPSPTPRQRRGATPADAVHAGVRFLIDARRDGHWTDFSLPVGRSDAWVTAYVLARLGELDPARRSGFEAEIEGSVDWLAAARSAGGGWGYNDMAGEDADSTAWAILALRRHGRPVPVDALRTIERCCAPDGMVATYHAGSSLGAGWTSPAPDVSAVALQALGTPPHLVLAGLLARWIQPDGLLPAYWWASPLHTLAAVLDWTSGAGLPVDVQTAAGKRLGQWTAESDFESSLLLRCLCHLRMDGARQTARDLLAHQWLDGSWSGSAVLRLTRPDVLTPWETIDAGPLFADQERIFTTATAVSALALHERGRRA
jgi:hypothetical protein